MHLFVIATTVLAGFIALRMAFFYRAHKTFRGIGHWTLGWSLIVFGT